MRIIRAITVFVCLIFLCSCATKNSFHSELPSETSFNENAGRGDWVRIKLHLQSGKELSLMVDTGGPHTVLDKSLEPLLGKRIGTGTWFEPFLGGLVKVGLYHAPKLYLGKTQLVTSSRVYTYDLQKKSPGLMGILGMDCLRNYCVQFDFVNRKLRFLDPNLPGNEDLGEAFPLSIIFGLVVARADCFGTGRIFFCPDTGCNIADAMLKPRLFRRVSNEQKSVWNGQFTTLKNHTGMIAGFPKGTFGGKTYTNLIIMEWAGTWPAGDLIGLPLLARNLATFNFPKRMMYLKQESVEPLNGGVFSGVFLVVDATQFLDGLKAKSALPGWSKNDKGQVSGSREIPVESYPFSWSLNIQKNGDSTVYHYTVVRESKNSPWKLQKASHTDAKGRLIKEYPVP
jgi:hypothetical protein